MKSNILLVDDEPRFIDSLHSILQHFNYICTKATTGTEAIEYLKTNQFDLALLDVELPDICGCSIVEFIKTSNIPTAAVMLTGINTVETAVKAMKTGAYDFLRKPINHEILLSTINKALQHNTLKNQLQVSENRFETLSEAAWEGIVIHEDLRIIEANDQFLKMFNYTRAELLQGLFLQEIFAPASLEMAKQFLNQQLNGNSEVIGMRKDGTEFYAEIKARPIQYLKKPRQVCVIRDISEQVRAMEDKLILQKKLAKANKFSALGLMAGSVAHDLNNILSGIVSYPDLLLLQMQESDKYYQPIKKIQAAGKRAAAVVSDLVTIARGNASIKTVENINDIILNHLSSIEHLERLANFPQAVIQTQLHKNLHNTCCSEQHLHKILLNLIGNALEVLADQGKIHISTENCMFLHPMVVNEPEEQATDYIKLTVSDNGPGIKKEHIDSIFDPFYTTKVMGKSGTGLGLSIVWNIVQDHNGWVEIKDNKPGAIFEIYLPVSHDAVCPVQDIPTARSLRGNGETILIIDDQNEQNEIIGKALQEMGYVTYSVTSGEAGIAFLESELVDLVLLDMMMGDGLNGRETYEKMLGIHPRQKAIVISGYAKSEEIAKAKMLGVSQFIEKPVTISEIGMAIKRSLACNLTDVLVAGDALTMIRGKKEPIPGDHHLGQL
ncbi:MAG: response regulator [Desulforhopalus sp.]